MSCKSTNCCFFCTCIILYFQVYSLCGSILYIVLYLCQMWNRSYVMYINTLFICEWYAFSSIVTIGEWQSCTGTIVSERRSYVMICFQFDCYVRCGEWQSCTGTFVSERRGCVMICFVLYFQVYNVCGSVFTAQYLLQFLVKCGIVHMWCNSTNFYFYVHVSYCFVFPGLLSMW